MTRIPPILLLTVLGAIAMLCVSQVKFSAGIYELLPADLPEVQGMNDLNTYFSRDGQLIVTVKTAEEYFTGEAATALADRLLEKPDLVARVHQELELDQLALQGGGMLAWMWLNSPPEDFSKLVARLGPDQSGATIAESMAMVQEGILSGETVIRGYDPLVLAKLHGELGETDLAETDPMASPDGTFRILYFEGSGVDFSDYRQSAKWLDQFKTEVEAWRLEWAIENVPVKIGMTGTPAFMAEVGSKIERDMTISMFATMALIGLLFWIMHRQSKPLSWLIAAMLVILSVTILIAGVVFGDLSVMSAGFGAILIGLAVDYGIVLYREAMTGDQTAKELRKVVGPSILWAAGTTAIVFLSLNFSSLPGLAELGNLVAIGIFVGALIMLWGFAPIAVQFGGQAKGGPGLHRSKSPKKAMRRSAITAMVVPVLAVISCFVGELPGLEAQFHPFRIRESQSVQAWAELQSNLKGRDNAVPITITADSVEELRENSAAAETRLKKAEADGMIERFILPTAMIPDPKRQAVNLKSVVPVLSEKSRLLAEIDAAGFSEEGKTLTTEMFSSWEVAKSAVEANGFALPTGNLGEWSIGRLFTEKDGTFAALGTVRPVDRLSRDWVLAICDETTSAASLGSLGTALNERITMDMKRVFLPMICVLAVMLGFVFREWRDLLLSLFCLAFAAAAILIVTIWTPMSWNSFNICGLPLLFGTGLDFSIHMIFALRRCSGDLGKARLGIGNALIFCGMSSAIGFGSLAISAADGLSSLGIVCAVGIFINMAIAVWLLPRWYRWIHRLK